MMRVKIPKSSDAVCVLLDVYHSEGLLKQKVAPDMDDVEINLPDSTELLGICCQFLKAGMKPDLNSRQIYDATEGQWVSYDDEKIEDFKSFKDHDLRGGDPISPELKDKVEETSEQEEEGKDHFEQVDHNVQLYGEASE